jgi:arylformamidase
MTYDARPRGSGEEVEVSTAGDEPTTDRRAKFDFEVAFSNGGGLQGQGFRLDIEGEDISDEELARYVVEDMRLLMVEEVRILDKEIIAERHKRLEPS